MRYDLDRHEHGALRPGITLLPPHVAHTGRPATPAGFRKRVLYLDTAVLDEDLTGAAVANPSLPDDLLRVRVAQLHASLDDHLAAESRLALVGDRLRRHLGGADPAPAPDRLAVDLRDLLDAHLVDGLTLRAAADVLHAHPAHLVRRFSARVRAAAAPLPDRPPHRGRPGPPPGRSAHRGRRRRRRVPRPGPPAPALHAARRHDPSALRGSPGKIAR